FMEPKVLASEPEFLWRRLLDPPPEWSVWVPVGFVVFVIYLIGVLRQEKKSLASLMLPVMTGSLILIGVGINTWLVENAVNWGIWLPVCLAATVAYFIGLCVTHPKLRIMLVPMLICTGMGILYAIAGLRLLLSLFSWWYLLVPTIAVALFY